MRWLVVVAWISVAATARAQSSPGPLGKSHASIACDRCHANGAMTNAQCEACHPSVQRGLHARAGSPGSTALVTSVPGKPCWTCHGDHKGASFDMQGWRYVAGGMQRFDHAALAGWPLAGRHAALACARCHTSQLPSGRTRFVGLSTTCGAAGCHQTNPHRFAGPEFLSCDRCHTDAAWKPVKRVLDFDHDRDTRLPLDGAHRGVPCVACHPKGEFALAKAECSACHQTPHGTRFAAIPGGCETCHDGAKWQTIVFEHTRHAKFPLIGRHHTLTCRSCHRGTSPTQFEVVPRGCKDCHAHTKVHADADHPNGKFATQDCIKCHPPAPTHSPPNLEGVFHGPRSQFPLVKAHRDLPCAQCHTERNAKGKMVFEKLSIDCADACHTADDVHTRALGKQCSRCHVSGTWDALGFEHTTYALEGPHRKAACASCHTDKQFKGTTPRRCIGCHAKDDVHQGALGTTCDRCHLANGENRFNHTISAKFKLDGKHLSVRCADCHPSRTFKPRPFACGACHPEPRAHFGKYGTWCERCHTTKGWR